MTELPSDYLYPPTPAQQALIDTMLDVRIPPPQRAEAGRQLATLGDPRRGVGVLPNGIPDIVWCEVPGTDQGSPFVPFGGDDGIPPENVLPAQVVDINTFWIAQYPITCSQYQAFIDDRAYDTPDWWDGLEKTAPKAQHFKFSNHPRETVTWFEAMAFCRWLSAKMEREIRLPTEEEWEKPARGGFIRGGTITRVDALISMKRKRKRDHSTSKAPPPSGCIRTARRPMEY